MNKFLTGLATISLLGGAAGGCAHERQAFSTTTSPLALSHVVLYRNGVGYFERHGVVDGDKLSLKVRKDQVNDLLKSLTVIDRGSGKALSVSIPLDPKAWQDAALSMLTPGNGRLSEVLDALRGTRVSVETRSRTVQGRIVMVERMSPEPRPIPLELTKIAPQEPNYEDHKLTLLDGDTLEVVRLSQVLNVTLRDGDLAMQLDRHLDATAGEGMFQQVDVVVRLASKGKHELDVSYVAPAPLWKPTYRLVLSPQDENKALLQAWAVVSNVSGENWDGVALGLTSGAPLAFRYDLHTPEEVERPDLSASGVQKHAQVSMGESTYGDAGPAATAAAPPMPQPSAAPVDKSVAAESYAMDDEAGLTGAGSGGGGVFREEAEKKVANQAMRSRRAAAPAAKPMAPPAMDMAALAQSVAPQASAKRVAGLTRFDLGNPVTLPDGSASMVALVNQMVPGEETFLFKPGGGGQGYELNPYRVVRFKNDTDFVLEPGPISIYSGGSFVGEGLSEAIASHDMATIPFAVEPSILVRSWSDGGSGDQMKIVRIVRGVMEVESFSRVTTTWSVEAKPSPKSMRVLVRQFRAGAAFALVEPPKDTETLPDGYFIPVLVPAGQSKVELKVVERSPSRLSLTIWDDKAPELLKQLLEVPNLDPKARAALQPIVDARQAIGKIDTQIEGLSEQQNQLDQRANEERENLHAIQKDPRATALRKRLSDRLEELTKQAAEVGRKLVELSSQRMEQKINLEDRLRDLDFEGGGASSPAAAPVSASAPSAPESAPRKSGN